MIDENIGAEAHQFPENENHEEIVRENDAQHRKHEQRKAAEITRPRSIVVHVANRKDMHSQANQPDDRQHECRQVIKEESD